MEGSRTKLSNWFLAIYLVATEGTSASYFSKITGVTYKTSWLILTKIRYMLSQSDADTLLLGVVKVNAAYYGRPHNPSTQLHPQEHPVLIGSSMNDHGQLEYIKIKQVQPKHMRGKLVSNVGTKVFTQQHVDPWFSSLDYVTARFSPKRFHALLFTVAQANRWINDTFHGLGAKHLQAYLDEFCYRLNRDLDDTPILHHIFSLCTSTRTKNYSTLIQRPATSLQIAC
ncbi:ISXO2-like transposase domain protein [compost metagenome]